jgi:molecular chaperone DnaK (HSP70)
LKIEANERGIAAGAYRLGVFADGEELTEHELDLTLERRQLDTLIEPLVAQAMEQVAEALNVEKAPSGGAEGLPGNLVEGPRDLIVLKVGGSSQLKLFEERLNELVGVGKVWNHQRPELAVGMGAAELVVKYPQRPEEGDFPARYPVGIRMKGDVFQEFIKADERCPVECSLPLSAEDDPLQVSVYEYTGSSRDVRAGEQAGEEVRVYPSPLTPGEDYSLVGWYEIRGFRGRGGIFDLTLGISAEREVTVKASQKTAEGSRHELTVEGQGRPIRDD